MQTFLSEPTFHESIAVLDNSRLTKQLLEGRQILNAIARTERGEEKVGYGNHPVTNQWRGHEGLLSLYLALCAAELKERGIKYEDNWNVITQLCIDNGWWERDTFSYPEWWTDLNSQDKIIYTHRNSLYNKNPEHYAQYRDFAECFDLYRERLVCCTSHAPYYYPSHNKD